jgi:hypothetical protein
VFDMRRTIWKRIIGVASIAMQVLTVGCDPGMTIRQSSITGRAPGTGSTAESHVGVSVKTTHPIIGNTSYFAEVDVVNAYASPISVTNIDLFARNKTYRNESPRPEDFPARILPGETASLAVMFRLDDDLWKTFFRKPADLLVHYQTGSEQKVARATIVGAHLDGSR